MNRNDFAHVRSWVFDLDDTLYLPEEGLFSQIEKLMTRYVANYLTLNLADANKLRKYYRQKYGTTLSGLMAEHHINPKAYLDYVHDVDFSVLSKDQKLADKIKALPGQKIIYTNATIRYAQKVLSARGLCGVFDAIYGVEEAKYHAKPHRYAFEEIFFRAGIKPQYGAMFEDSAPNLEVPFAMGMRTIYVSPCALDRSFITHHTNDLTIFLTELTSTDEGISYG